MDLGDEVGCCLVKMAVTVFGRHPAAVAGCFRLDEHSVWSVYELEVVDVDDRLDVRLGDGVNLQRVSQKVLPLFGGGSRWEWRGDAGLWCNSDLASPEVAVHGQLQQVLCVLHLLLGGVETERRVALTSKLSHDDGG